MKMTPEEFLFSFVRGNLSDFREDKGNVRKGMNAAVSMFHLSDHYFNYWKANDFGKLRNYPERIDFLRHLEGLCSQFLDIQSIANAYKHLYLDTTKAHVSISSAGAIESFETDELKIDFEYQRNQKVYEVFYHTKTGEKKCLLDALESTYKMWQQFLYHPENQ